MDKCPTADVTLEDIEMSAEPAKPSPASLSDGPYWQMVYYAVCGFLFWAILMIQIPFVDKYYGGPQVIFYITFAYGLSSNIIRIFLVWAGNRAKSSIGAQMKNLVIYGASLTGLTMIAFPVSMFILGQNNPVAGFWTCIVLSCLMGLFNSLIMNVGFALMSMSPDKSATFYLLGQTTTGVVTWPLIILLRVIVSAAGGGENTDFIVAVFTLTLAGLVTIGLIPLYQYKTQYHPVFVNLLLAVPPKAETGAMWRVYKLIFVPIMCGWVCSIVTFSVFPSQIGRWLPAAGAVYDTSLYRSFLIYMFSISDTVGRSLPRFFPGLMTIKNRKFVILTFVRGFVVIPLFLLSSNGILGYDWFRLILVLAFGVSSGANFGLANILSPKLVGPADKMHVGTIISFVAVNGLFVGSLIGIGFKEV